MVSFFSNKIVTGKEEKRPSLRKFFSRLAADRLPPTSGGRGEPIAPISSPREMTRSALYRNLDRGVEAAPCFPVVVGYEEIRNPFFPFRSLSFSQPRPLPPHFQTQPPRRRPGAPLAFPRGLGSPGTARGARHSPRRSEVVPFVVAALFVVGRESLVARRARSAEPDPASARRPSSRRRLLLLFLLRLRTS